MLLLMLLLLPATASTETSAGVFFKSTNQSCPETGYFFEKEPQGPGPDTCYLCFCQDDDQAVCTLRNATSCNEQHYIHQKREIIKRVRRTPGLADIFFRDATRQIFNREPTQEECKPSTSKSIGCPPDDWCKGCMVCDCDANGHWDCHLMSFCDENAKKKGKKSKKGSKKKPINARPIKKEDKKNNSKDDSKKTGKRIVKKSVNNPKSMPLISVETKKTFKRKDDKSPLVIKKYISTNGPIKSADLMKYKNDPSKLAQVLYRQYLSNLNKAPNKIKKHTTVLKHKNGKKANNKRVFKKNQEKNKMQHNKPMNTNKNKHKNNPKLMKHKRQMRDSNKKQLKKKSTLKGKKYVGSKKDSSKRSKREVSFFTDLPKRITNFDGIKTAVFSTTSGTEISFTNRDNIHTNLNKYAYTIDNRVTARINNNETRNVSQYDATERYFDIFTIDGNNYTTRFEESKSATVKTQVEHTSERRLKETTVYDDSLRKPRLMNNEYLEQNATIKTIINKLINKSENWNDVKRKVYLQDVKKMKLAKKKLNLKKFVKALNSRINFTRNNDIYMNRSLVDNKSDQTRVKIDVTLKDIQRLLEKMLHGATKNKKTKERLKTKSFTAIKYLKKLFSKLFSRSKNHTTVEKVAVLDSICETFGPCRISNKKMKIVNSKVKQLVSETLRALYSIKIIKGLLKLLNNRKENCSSQESDFKIHLKKLNDILKEDYSPKIKWTQTQTTQMNYIKSNTQVFIKSIGNFATILNDIISIIKSESEQFKLKQQPMVQNRFQNIHVIPKIKRLILKYNLIQNTFLRKMYGALTNVEETVKNESVKEYQHEKEAENNMTYKIAIEKYVDNINENLQKLKDLAARMDSKVRRKRDTGNDDAIEYLLTLMEYLLKKNNPIDIPPVKDGIDLLIEAIRRAPDIRPIKKPILQYVPVGAANSAVSKEESDSKSKNDDSKEDSKDVRGKTDEESSDNDIDRVDRGKDTKIDVTTKKNPNFVDLSDVITEYPSKVYMASYVPYENTEKPDNDTASITGMRNDADPLVVDDEDMKMIRKAESDLEAGIQPRATTMSIFKEDKEEVSQKRHYVHTTVNPDTAKEPKTKLDLINEAYEQEIREQNEKTTVKPDNKLKRVENKTRQRGPKVSADISSITKEVSDEKQKPIDAVKVAYRKQMDFLNSLDYGTDRSLIDDSDSKDRSPVDRLNNDNINEAFLSY